MRVRLPNGWTPRDSQLPVWKYLERGGKHAEIVAHRRWGKDDVALHRTAIAAFERVGTYWHCLPEYAQARKAIWGAVNPHTGKRRIDEAFPRELRGVTREDEMFIQFINGSTWQVIGSDRYDSLVGSGPAGIVYSEWALTNPAVRAYLRPIITENHGWQFFITTPRGRNHAYTTFKAAERLMLAGGDAFAQLLDATETNVFTPEQLAVELAEYISTYGEDYGRAKFEQEYLVSFEAANIGAILARAVGMAEKQGRINDAVAFDPYGQPLDISADIGRRDTATWWFWQPAIGGYRIVDHDSGWGIDADEWCYRLKAKIDAYQLAGKPTALGRIYLPHDARAKTFSAKRSAVEIFVEHFGADHVAITPNSSKADRINAARVLTPRVEFHATKCERGLNALRSWSYEYDEEKKTFSAEPLHDWCFAPGTKVLADVGWTSIEDLSVRNRVVTPLGMRRIMRSGIVRMTDTWTLTKGIKSTPEHRFFTKRGLIKAQNLQKGDEFWTHGSWGLTALGFMCAALRLGFMAAITSATPEQSRERRSSYIGWCMRLCAVKFRPAMKYIMSMMTRSIIIHPTWKLCPDSSIEASTNQSRGFNANAESAAPCLGVTKNSVHGVAHHANASSALNSQGKKEPAYSLSVDVDACYFVRGNDGKAYLVSNSSHDGDGFSYGCLVMQQAEPPKPPPPPMRGLMVGVPSVSLEEMWAETRKTTNSRI